MPAIAGRLSCHHWCNNDAEQVTQSASSLAVVEASGISHSYGKIQALRNISLRFASGQIIGVIGPDGVWYIDLAGAAGWRETTTTGQVAGAGRRYATSCAPQPYLPAYCLYATGFGQKPVSNPVSGGESAVFCQFIWSFSGRGSSLRILQLTQATGLGAIFSAACR